jgi:hypothetical protein
VAGGSSLPLQLDQESASVIATLTDAVVIGTIHIPTGILSLYHSLPLTDPSRRCFPGHRELVAAGLLLHPGEYIGFSLEVKACKVRAFYRTSLLNVDLEEFAVPDAMMLEVLSALPVPCGVDFRSYP